MSDISSEQEWRDRYEDLIEKREHVISDRVDIINDSSEEFTGVHVSRPNDPRQVDSKRYSGPGLIPEWHDSIEEIRSSDGFQQNQAELKRVDAKIEEFWNEVRQNLVNPDVSKIENLGLIWRVFGKDVPSEELEILLDISGSYLDKLRYDAEKETAVLKSHVKERKQDRASPHKKEDVLKRDDHACVRCGEEEPARDLVVHHIIPISRGGKDSVKNLATLFKKCHGLAHGGNTRDSPVYGDEEQFWNWVEHEEFIEDRSQTTFSDY